MGDGVRVLVLGPLQVLDAHGRAVDIGGHRQRRALAKLVMHNGDVVASEDLIAAVWADRDRPQHSDRALRTYVSRLRKALTNAGAADSVLRTDPPGYRLVLPADATDAYDLATAVAACAAARRSGDDEAARRHADIAQGLWRGRPYEDVAEELWATKEIRRLEELAATAGEERAEVLLAQGNHVEAVADLQRLVAQHPLREHARAQLMLALVRSGRQAEALRAYQSFRASLIEHTGLEPSGAIKELEQRIVAGDPRLLDIEPDGRLLRAYRMTERIGEGSFAVVWRGFQPSVGREVAIKQIRAELANRPEFIARFEAEAHLIARLEHPHIVPLYDYWREPGSAYLVMRWLRGGTLESRAGIRPLDAEECVRLASQVGAALSAAHRAGVVHRDVKPANVLLDDEGNFFLGDFGIALEAAQQAYPEAALSAGSPAYAAPEQLRRQPVGPSADVHGLGIVLYEALTGQLPFPEERTHAALLERQLNDPVPPVRRIRPDLPAALDAVIARATAKEPAERFGDIASMVAAVQSAFGADGDNAGPGRRRPSATMVAGETTNPYKGLRSFTEADAPDFFGRARLVDQLLGCIRGSEQASGRVVAVVGPSGIGKSSVVRAGLLPALRRGELPGSERWFVATMLPGRDPFEELAPALMRVAADPPASLMRTISEDPRGLARVVKAIVPEGGELLLVIDQFEELFTLTVDETVRRRFLDALTYAGTDARCPLRVVLTLRADFYDRPLRHGEFARLIRASTVTVLPLAPDELERAIVDPATRAGCEFQPGLVSAIVADVADQPAALPMLQYALTELYNRNVSGLFTLEAYRDLGGVVGALARRAEELFTAAPPAQQDACRRLFTRLVTLGDGVEDTRRRVLHSELGADPATEAVLGSFGAARLLSFDRDPATREPTVEVAHEALLHAWPRLRSWLEQDRDHLRLQRHLTDAARAWDQRGRDDGDLYRGARLEAALEWASSNGQETNHLEEAFLAAAQQRRSVEAEQLTRTNRRLRTLLAGVAVALVLALLAGTVALVQQQRASRNATRAEAALSESLRSEEEAVAATRDADVERLIAQSKASVPLNRQLAMLLGLEGDRLRPGRDTEAALLTALIAEPRFIGALPGSADYTALDASTDGTITAIDRSGQVSRWDSTTHQQLPGVWKTTVTGLFARFTGTVSLHRRAIAFGGTTQVVVADRATGAPLGPIIEVPSAFNQWTPVALSADLSTVYIGGGTGSAPGTGSGTVTPYDIATGRPSGTALVGGTARVRNIALRPDGGALAAGLYDGSVLVWDLATGTETARLPHRSRQVSGVAWSPDGTLLTSVSAGVGIGETVLWSTADWHDIARYPSQPGTIGTSAAFTADSRQMALLDSRGSLIEVALPSGSVRGSPIDTQTLGSDIVYSADDATLFTAGQIIAHWAGTGPMSIGRSVAGALPSGGVWSPDGTVVAYMTDGRNVRLIEAASGRPIGADITVPDPDLVSVGGFSAVAFTGDGRSIAVSGGGASVQFHLVSTGQPVGPTIRDPSLTMIASIDSSPDGTRLALGGGGRIAIVDRSTGAGLHSVELSGNRAFPTLTRWVAGDRIIAWEFGRSLALIDAANGSVLATEPISGSVGAISADGELVAIGHTDGTIELRHTNDLTPLGEPIAVLSNNIVLAAFSADSSQLIAGNDLGSARLIDLDTAQVLEAGIPSPIPQVFFGGGLAVSPDGRELLTARAQGGLNIWSIDPDVWRRRACELVGRNLTAQEWARYLPNGDAHRKTCEQWPLDAS